VASWTLERTLVAVADSSDIVGSLHVEPSRFGFGEIGMMGGERVAQARRRQ